MADPRGKGMPAESQRLVVRGRELEDDRKMAGVVRAHVHTRHIFC